MAENPPNATIYIKNLDEKVKIPALEAALRDTFEEFGDIIDVVAKKNLRARGQAFIVFSSPEEAELALESLQGFEIFERPMDIQYAKTRSDATVQQVEGEAGLEQHKKQRIAEKERKQALAAAEAQAKPAKRAAAESLAERPAKSTKPGPGANQDEYLPPNKILLLRELPEDYGKEALTAVFQRFPGFKEVRVVPGRKGLAFAEYEDETGSTAAREAMNGVTLGEKTIKVTFQRQ
ncbi:hypothetical protein DOTSEDRAFT_27368 [Dothistroma septosporum NZE10]|uniref:RRM domain-containing protein n=1 Tax=Dothistroma septosporum (strain NZE10 / CBS 128990) TaxID=675120 RepID=N1PEI7_DOTSN|nr:hypothetical protein DOTSEDRAFT_27368 [Dothistroma septosporum NZE10]